MKKPSWCEKHFKIRQAVSELQNSSSHFNRTALYVVQKQSQIINNSFIKSIVGPTSLIGGHGA